jgi:hypothetical protein
LIYWPTGNPSPSNYGGERKGDNLYSNSMLALDADTGKLRWHYQFTPHDLYDYDATQIPVLIDTEWEGRPRKLLVQANRNGFLYVLDRTNGQFLSAKAFGNVTWANGIAPDGKPIVNSEAIPDATGKRVCPGAIGLTNWFSPSYNPQTKLLYVATTTECDIFTSSPQQFRAGHDFLGSIYVPDPKERPSGSLKALDPLTGSENGSLNTSAIRMQARSRLREAWSSQENQTATSSYLTRTLGRTFGTFNLVRPYIQRRSLIVLMVGSTSLFRRALRFLPLHSQKHECHGTAFVETLSVTSVSIH